MLIVSIILALALFAALLYCMLAPSDALLRDVADDAFARGVASAERRPITRDEAYALDPSLAAYLFDGGSPVRHRPCTFAGCPGEGTIDGICDSCHLATCRDHECPEMVCVAMDERRAQHARQLAANRWDISEADLVVERETSASQRDCWCGPTRECAECASERRQWDAAYPPADAGVRPPHDNCCTCRDCDSIPF